MKVTIVKAEDWQGIYFDNTLEKQYHSVSAQEAFELMMQSPRDYVEELDVVFANDEWLDTIGLYLSFKPWRNSKALGW